MDEAKTIDGDVCVANYAASKALGEPRPSRILTGVLDIGDSVHLAADKKRILAALYASGAPANVVMFFAHEFAAAASLLLDGAE